jgi:hypothetical protein
MREYVSRPEAQEGGPEAAQTTIPMPGMRFTLDGEEFRCIEEMDADAFLEWSELAVAATEDVPLTSPEAAAFFARFMRATFGPQEYARLRRHFRRHGTRPQVVLAIISDIQEQMAETVETATGRPTPPPSSSSAGPEEMGERAAKVVSLQTGDVSFVDAPPKAPRKQGKRSAG